MKRLSGSDNRPATPVAARLPFGRRPQRGEAGFTLVELLVAIVIESLIMAALGTAFVGILRGTGVVSASFAKSGDARIAAAYIISDARNSSGPETSLTDTTSCPDPNPPVAGTATPVVRFNWNSTSAAGVTTANIVNYVLVANTLLRRVCQGALPVSDHAVGTNVQSAVAVCSPTADCTGSPTSITATITETVDVTGAPYAYALTGAFQKVIGGGAPPIPSNPRSVILLGDGSTCSGTTNTVDIQGSGFMRVYGDAFINSADGASCHALYVANSGTFQAGRTSIITNGSCLSGTIGDPCPPTTTVAAAATNPYANLAAPPITGLPARTGCSGTGSQTALPGMYASGFALAGGNTCTLASGIYVVQGGFNISNGATLLTGAGGVLIYLLSGQFAVSGAAGVTLTAMTSGTYSGLALWQAATNDRVISLSNGGVLTFNGFIYAPKADMNVGGNSQTPYVTGIVVQTIILSNSGGITVGAPSSPPLAISTVSLPPWTVNRPYAATLTSTGGDGNEIWSSTTLPTGLSLDAGTGVISGTPTVVSSLSVTVTLNDQLGDDPDTMTSPLVISAAPSISTASLPGGTVGLAYAGVTMATSGGTAPFAGWAATGLPGGLSINASTGAISGTPTVAGTFSAVLVSATDAAGAPTAVHAAYTIVIRPAPTITLLSPASRVRGASTQAVAITGTNFIAGAPLAATFSGSGITVNSIAVASATTINMTVTITTGATTGLRSVTLVNGDGSTAVGTNVFTVNAIPTITTIVAATHTRNFTGFTITINGTGFQSGATVTMTATAGTAPTITQTTWVSATSMTIKLTIPNATSTDTIKVTNPDGGTASKTSAFTVT